MISGCASDIHRKPGRAASDGTGPLGGVGARVRRIGRTEESRPKHHEQVVYSPER